MTNLQFDIPKEELSIIKVIGLGGGGGNAVNYMYEQGIKGVQFIVCNTDKQALDFSPIETKIQIGNDLTGGRGVGGNPDIGRKAALESYDEIKEVIGEETKMLFITTGMGGGTGSGTAPVVAKIAREMDILTVGIVTYPFQFEGEKRKKIAEGRIGEFKKYVDALIIIHNDRLLEMFQGLVITKAFAHADNVLAIAAKGIAEIITVTGIMNVDFEDVRSIMKDSGTAIMGSAIAEGENRAKTAITEALNSPLLKDNDIKGAKHILLNLTYGKKEVEIDELTQITEHIKNEVGDDVDLKFGHCNDESLENELSVTIIATSLESGDEDKQLTFDDTVAEGTPEPQEQEKKFFNLTKEEEEEIAQQGTQMKFEFEDDTDPFLKKDKKESEKLKQFNYSINTPEGLEEAETKPAYQRKAIQLVEVPHSSDSEISRLTLDDDERPELKENNAFLADNID